jgi:hypothetical protein
MQTKPYVEQLRRMARWWEKVEAAYGKNAPADEMMDLFYAFFQNCFFVRDWLLNSGVAKEKVDAAFSGKALSLCRDMANGTKHCVINRPPIVDAEFRTVREYDPQLRRLGSKRTEVFYVLAAGQKYDMFALGILCQLELQRFLISEGLFLATSELLCEQS